MTLTWTLPTLLSGHHLQQNHSLYSNITSSQLSLSLSLTHTHTCTYIYTDTHTCCKGHSHAHRQCTHTPLSHILHDYSLMKQTAHTCLSLLYTRSASLQCNESQQHTHASLSSTSTYAPHTNTQLQPTHVKRLLLKLTREPNT